VVVILGLAVTVEVGLLQTLGMHQVVAVAMERAQSLFQPVEKAWRQKHQRAFLKSGGLDRGEETSRRMGGLGKVMKQNSEFRPSGTGL